jgi:CheY-like chemotaxis protein
MHNGLPFNILIVEDDAEDRMMIDEAFLEIGYGCQVKKFINGDMLLQYLEQVEPSLYPSLIVLDNTLPGLDARGILGILKKHAGYKLVPVVIYTTILTPSKTEQLMAAGAHLCLEKGSTMQELTQVAKDLRNLADAGIADS